MTCEGCGQCRAIALLQLVALSLAITLVAAVVRACA